MKLIIEVPFPNGADCLTYAQVHNALEGVKRSLPLGLFRTTSPVAIRCGEKWQLAQWYVQLDSVPSPSPPPPPILVREETDPVTLKYGRPLAELTPPKGWTFTGEMHAPRGEYYMRPDGVPVFALDQHLEDFLILERAYSIADVYGTSQVPIPAGWKFKEFRKVRVSERVPFLSLLRLVDTSGADTNQYLGYRIVLEQDLSTLEAAVTANDVYPDGVPTIPVGFKFVRFGVADVGNLYLRGDGSVARVVARWRQFVAIILEKV